MYLDMRDGRAFSEPRWLWIDDRSSCLLLVPAKFAGEAGARPLPVGTRVMRRK